LYIVTVLPAGFRIGGYEWATDGGEIPGEDGVQVILVRSAK